uniref:RBD domain-containing protein n=1 Tax=Clastoptera arizonana TaxID=38151 RepID=A0A1B6C8Q0_9HEMI
MKIIERMLCLKLRSRGRSWGPSSEGTRGEDKRKRSHTISKMSPPMRVTEDTPPDMLVGSMDLRVVLPGGRNVKMSVDRSTPMMDLLVQVTTANKISPGDHMIQAMGERGVLPYKPSTPIGALDIWTIQIMPKSQMVNIGIKKAPLKPINQPFEQTFRLQVHLPRNQLYVSRVSPKARLSDILLQVCSEKNLDPSRYSLRHPTNLDQLLNLKCTLADYKLQEVTVVCNTTLPVEVSTVDIMALQRDSSNNYINRNNKSSDGSVSSGSLGGRSLSPVPSDESSTSPPPPPPSRPIRKRRPAPKPPTINNIGKMNGEKLEKETEISHNTTVICHSRNSSDSSGYHEASVLSESPQSNSLPDSLPRRSKLPSITSEMTETSLEVNGNNLSRSLSSLTAVDNSTIGIRQYNHSISTSSLSTVGGRKKKAAPPPPPIIKMSSLKEEQQRTSSVSSTTSSTTTLDGNDVTVLQKSATLPVSSRVPSITAEDPLKFSQSSPVDDISSENPETHIQGRFVLPPSSLINQTRKIINEIEVIEKDINAMPRSPGSLQKLGDVKLHKKNNDFKTSTLPTLNRFANRKEVSRQKSFQNLKTDQSNSSNSSRFALSPSKLIQHTKKIIQEFDKSLGKDSVPKTPSYLKNNDRQWRRKHVKKNRSNSNQIDVHFVSNNFSNYLNDDKLKLNIKDLKLGASKSFNVKIKEIPLEGLHRSHSFHDEFIQDVGSGVTHDENHYYWDNSFGIYVNDHKSNAEQSATNNLINRNKTVIKFKTQYDGRGGSIKNHQNIDRNVHKSNSLSEKINNYNRKVQLLNDERDEHFMNSSTNGGIKRDKNALNTCESFRLKLEKFNAELNKHTTQVSKPESNKSVPIKCNLLAPPPPNLLVNRRESSESWNKFLRQLDDILENRAGEYV